MEYLKTAPAIAVQGVKDRVYKPSCKILLTVAFNQENPSDVSKVTPTFDVTPKTCTITRNNTRSPDTFRADIDYWRFPIDPRTVDSILCAIYFSDGRLESKDLENYEYLSFMGYVDTPTISLDASGTTVKLEGRDYTSLFLDYRWVESIRIDKPLPVVLQGVLEGVPGVGRLVIEFASSLGTGLLSDVVGRTLYTPSDDSDAWTVITELCAFLALTPYIYLDVLVVSDAKSFGKYQATFGKRLSSYNLKKDYSGIKKRQVELRCWDAALGVVKTAKWPVPPPLAKKVVATDGSIEETPVPTIPFFVQGSHSQVILEQMAKAVYKDVVRNEVEGSFMTKELWDDANKPIVPYLSNGDRVVLDVNLSNSVYNKFMKGLSDQERLQFLVSQGLSPEQAAYTLLSKSRAEGLRLEFYIRECTHEWSTTSGYTFTCEFINYVGEYAEVFSE